MHHFALKMSVFDTGHMRAVGDSLLRAVYSVWNAPTIRQILMYRMALELRILAIPSLHVYAIKLTQNHAICIHSSLMRVCSSSLFQYNINVSNVMFVFASVALRTNWRLFGVSM